MQFEVDAIIVGGRRFNDSVEGTVYDFTKVRVLMEVPESSENEIGYNVVEMPNGDHKNFDALSKYRGQFPLKARVVLKPNTKGYDFVSFTVPAAGAGKS